MASGKRIDVFERIHHQQSGHGVRKHVAEIVDDTRQHFGERGFERTRLHSPTLLAHPHSSLPYMASFIYDCNTLRLLNYSTAQFMVSTFMFRKHPLAYRHCL